ncbi:MAG TPA: DUF1772 domain-containing protein [Candidatus Acidoferrum sp.]|jgi:hypothetical protein|nr:DUF1772 domain-containing protein [Candidatus Angelobacter sp.]HXD82491.1 DUF1772 domain-containing protein [Candidatus Acidoferrum sp.]
MTVGEVVGVISVVFAGLLAGEEFVIRYGVRGPLASLDDQSHILFRQALIYRLRILVPAIYVLTLLSTVAVTVLDGTKAGMVFRGAAIAALAVWVAATLGGTVPINAAVLEWSASAPPATWRTQVDRWEHLNTLRTWAAVIAFISLSVSLALGALQ